MIFPECIPREDNAIPCPTCNGYCDNIPCTTEEIRTNQHCGSSGECCIAAFICRLCKTRIIAHREAPEME